jgi:hypothetical protein
MIVIMVGFLVGCVSGEAQLMAPLDSDPSGTSATLTTGSQGTSPTTPSVTTPTTGNPLDCDPSPTLSITSFTSESGFRATDQAFTIELSEVANVAMACTSATDSQEVHVVEGADTDAYTFRIQGLADSMTFECVAAATCPTALTPPSVLSFTTSALPSRLPAVTVETHPTHEVTPGYLLTQWKDNACWDDAEVVLLDTEGRMRWHQVYEHDGGAGIDVETLIEGDMLVVGGAGIPEGVHFYDLWDGRFHVADFPGSSYLHHDGRLLPDGRVIGLDEVNNDGGWASWLGFRIRTMDPYTGVVDWLYDSQEAVDQGMLPEGSFWWEDTYHANWMDWQEGPDGPVVYVSLCFAWMIVAIDPETHEMLWRIGDGYDFDLVDASGAALPDSEFPQCQHGIEIDSMAQTILVYDNAQARSESRASAYHFDTDTMTLTQLWNWYDPERWKESTLGDIDWMEDGRVLITQAHPECWSDSPGDHSSIVEVDPVTGDEWWRMTFNQTQDAIYRSERYDGCSLFDNAKFCPGLAARYEVLRPLLTP